MSQIARLHIELLRKRIANIAREDRRIRKVRGDVAKPQNPDTRIGILRMKIAKIERDNRFFEQMRKSIANTDRENRIINRRIRKLEDLARLAGIPYGTVVSNVPKSPESRALLMLKSCRICSVKNHIRDKSCKKCGATRAMMARGVYRELAGV